MSGDVRHLPGATASGPLLPLRERGPRRERRGRPFEEALQERGDAEAERLPAGVRAAPAAPAPRKPYADPETGGNLDVVA